MPNQTPTIKDQIAEQKKIVAMLEKRAKDQAKADAKELAEFNKYKNMVNSGKPLHQQVLRFQDHITNGTFAGCFGEEFYQWFGDETLQRHEFIFDMLEWSEDKRIVAREEVRNMTENDGQSKNGW
jgi:hypothetical protein